MVPLVHTAKRQEETACRQTSNVATICVTSSPVGSPLITGFPTNGPAEFRADESVSHGTIRNRRERRAMTETVKVQTAKCIVCGKSGEVEVPADGWEKFSKGAFVQDAFPDLSPGEREMLINGTHPACFDTLFPPEDQ
jgi:hypothetical protein